jgi:uncharacterized protein YqgC (DUF456 family)
VDLFADSILFGLCVVFMVVGLIGTIVPILPGTLISWLSVLLYAVLERFRAIDPITFVVITLIALVVGTSDIWMSLLGAKTGGASAWSMLYGLLGAILGFIVGTLFVVGGLLGAVLGYALGILLGEYRKHKDWNMAFKASLGGVAGWGLATAVQLGGGILMLLIFVWQVLSYSG